MKNRASSLVLSILVLAALAAAALAPATGAAPGKGAKPEFKAFASCANGKPFKPAKHCSYDGNQYLRATFVLQSNVGKRAIKSCFQITGPAPLGGGHACAKLKPTAYKAYPFKITGVREHFSVKVTWYAKTPGKGDFKQVAASSLKVTP
jgi:hypothetical protein